MKTSEPQERSPSTRLTEICWPVFEFVIHLGRQIRHGAIPSPEQVRYEALSAMRDAEELAGDDPVTERLWHDRIKAMMVYLIDYKMLNTDWTGRNYWFDHRFEVDPEVLNEVEALGGEKFFQQCDEIQKEYEIAERRDRRDKDELAEQLSLFFICLRLGFKGKYHDYPQELADYVRRLFGRLPAYATTRAKEMFPDSYRHNQEVKVDYRLGMSLTVVLVIFAMIVGASVLTFRKAWNVAVDEISGAASEMLRLQSPAASTPNPAAAGVEAGTEANLGKTGP